MTGSVSRIYTAGFLCSFILLSHITMTYSMSLDLTELRNKVSKIKVNPRGNLWASGHFMGKKSVVDSSSLESSLEDVDRTSEDEALSSLLSTEDLQTLLLRLLRPSRGAPHKRLLHIGGDPS